MKKKSILFFMTISLMLLMACGNSDDTSLGGGSGKFMVDLRSDVSYAKTTDGQTRAIDESVYQNLDNYIVELKDASGTVLKSGLYGAMGLIEEVQEGNYSLTAYYGEDVNAEYDKLFVKGVEQFTVAAGEQKKVTITCVPANVKVNVKYSSDFSTYYSDCTVGLKTQYIASPFLMSIADTDKDLYLKAASSGESLALTFDIKDLSGNSITIDGFNGKTVSVKPRDFLTITIKPKFINVDGGAVEGITITVDDSVVEEDVVITIPDEYLPGGDEA